MNTPHSKANAAFSEATHQIARELVYPRLFPDKELQYDTDTLVGTPRGNVLDGEMAIDRIVRVHCGFRAPIPITVQERFREPQYQTFQDLTITEWNTNSDRPSELFKLHAHLFVYGYANKAPQPTGLLECVVIDVPLMMLWLINGRLQAKRDVNKRSNQPFVTLRFQDLYDIGAVVDHFHYENPPEEVTDLAWSLGL